MGGGEASSPGTGEVTIVLLRSAVEDLVLGRAFYETQGEGLGDYFEASRTADIESLRLHAGIHVMAHGYHRMLSAKFPYAVYYDVVTDQVRVRAVLDTRHLPLSALVPFRRRRPGRRGWTDTRHPGSPRPRVTVRTDPRRG